MSNFEKNLDSHIRELDAKIGVLYTEDHNLDWGHDCDCDYCDREEMPPEETETRSAEIKKEIEEIENFKKVLIAHVERYKKTTGKLTVVIKATK